MHMLGLHRRHACPLGTLCPSAYPPTQLTNSCRLAAPDALPSIDPPSPTLQGKLTYVAWSYGATVSAQIKETGFGLKNDKFLVLALNGKPIKRNPLNLGPLVTISRSRDVCWGRYIRTCKPRVVTIVVRPWFKIEISQVSAGMCQLAAQGVVPCPCPPPLNTLGLLALCYCCGRGGWHEQSQYCEPRKPLPNCATDRPTHLAPCYRSRGWRAHCPARRALSPTTLTCEWGWDVPCCAARAWKAWAGTGQRVAGGCGLASRMARALQARPVPPASHPTHLPSISRPAQQGDCDPRHQAASVRLAGPDLHALVSLFAQSRSVGRMPPSLCTAAPVACVLGRCACPDCTCTTHAGFFPGCVLPPLLSLAALSLHA